MICNVIIYHKEQKAQFRNQYFMTSTHKKGKNPQETRQVSIISVTESSFSREMKLTNF